MNFEHKHYQGRLVSSSSSLSYSSSPSPSSSSRCATSTRQQQPLNRYENNNKQQESNYKYRSLFRQAKPSSSSSIKVDTTEGDINKRITSQQRLLESLQRQAASHHYNPPPIASSSLTNINSAVNSQIKPLCKHDDDDDDDEDNYKSKMFKTKLKRLQKKSDRDDDKYFSINRSGSSGSLTFADNSSYDGGVGSSSGSSGSQNGYYQQRHFGQYSSSQAQLQSLTSNNTNEKAIFNYNKDLNSARGNTISIFSTRKTPNNFKTSNHHNQNITNRSQQQQQYPHQVSLSDLSQQQQPPMVSLTKTTTTKPMTSMLNDANRCHQQQLRTSALHHQSRPSSISGGLHPVAGTTPARSPSAGLAPMSRAPARRSTASLGLIVPSNINSSSVLANHSLPPPYQAVVSQAQQHQQIHNNSNNNNVICHQPTGVANLSAQHQQTGETISSSSVDVNTTATISGFSTSASDNNKSPSSLSSSAMKATTQHREAAPQSVQPQTSNTNANNNARGSVHQTEPPSTAYQSTSQQQQQRLATGSRANNGSGIAFFQYPLQQQHPSNSNSEQTTTANIGFPQQQTNTATTNNNNNNNNIMNTAACSTTTAAKSKSCLTCADISIKWYIVVIALLGLICALIGTIVGAVHSAGRDYISLTLLLIGK